MTLGLPAYFILYEYSNGLLSTRFVIPQCHRTIRPWIRLYHTPSILKHAVGITSKSHQVSILFSCTKRPLKRDYFIFVRTKNNLHTNNHIALERPKTAESRSFHILNICLYLSRARFKLWFLPLNIFHMVDVGFKLLVYIVTGCYSTHVKKSAMVL